MVILVGYQAIDTPGRLVKEGHKLVEIGGKEIEIKCQIETAPFTGHSDSQELIQLVKKVKGLKKVFIVHSEREQGIELASAISKKTSVKVHVPSLGDVHNL